jgi:hypothetical protein
VTGKWCGKYLILLLTLSQGKGTERILRKESSSLVMTLLIFNAPMLCVKQELWCPKQESLLWSCSFVVCSFAIDAALKMVTTRSQIAERHVKIVPHTNAQQKKKKMKKNATEKKTEKKTDNKKMKKNATEKEDRKED